MANEGYHEPIDELSDVTRDMHRAIVSLMEELEAVDWYNQREYRPQFIVLAGVDALVVPVDGLEFFHQGDTGAMHVPRGIRQFADRLVIAFVCH